MRKLALLAATVMSIAAPMIAQGGVAQADDWNVRFSYGSQPAGRYSDDGYRDRSDRILTPRQIRHLVRQAHHDISSIELHGRTYIVRARNDDGRPVVMSLDACNGALLQIHYTDYGRWRDRGDRWDGDRDWNQPPPPPSYEDSDWRD